MSDDIIMRLSPSDGDGEDVSGFELGPNEVADAFGVPHVAPLGRGAFGETWRLDYPDGTRRAGKVILSPTYPVDRLGREVEGLRRVSDQHVVRLHASQTVNLSRGQRAALVFEYVSGGDVAHNASSGSRVDPLDVAQFARGVFAGLEALHSVETVHRDVKPANIALRDGQWARPVLLDLGLARVLDRSSLTAYPALLGTTMYMAPEQLRQERARKGADVFAVGVVAHLLLTGHHPFYEGVDTLTLPEAVSRIDAGPTVMPASVPSVLADLVRRLMHPEPAERGSARRARRELEAISDALGRSR